MEKDTNGKHYVQHESLRRRQNIRFALAGGKQIVKSKMLFPLLGFNVVSLCIWFSIHSTSLAAGLIVFLWRAAILTVLAVADSLICWRAGLPRGYVTIMREIERVPSFSNADHEAPVLISRESDDAAKGTECWTFESCGIAFKEWLEHQQQIENALDVAVIGFDFGADNRKTVLRVLPHPGSWPQIIPWKDEYMPPKPSEFVLGFNRSVPVTLDLAVNPHFLICAETGAGKTELVRAIIHQAIKKEYGLVLIDFKGFVDYLDVFPKAEASANSQDNLLQILKAVENEMFHRLRLFFDSGCKNIDEFNSKYPKTPAQRKIIVIDEFMDAIARGPTKEEKLQAEEIEKTVSSLCRRGRAAGIHILISLQRGGQEVDGQIRSNCRVILGRCNSNLSIVATGSTELGKLIPPDSVGMFVTDKGQLFKGFYGGF